MNCGVCERPFEPHDDRQLYCRRACTIRAADRRRRGLPILDPGYAPVPPASVGEDLRAARKLLERAAKKAEDQGLSVVLTLSAREAIRSTNRALEFAKDRTGHHGG